jgi:hypothetical protein
MTLPQLKEYIRTRIKESTLYSNPSKALSDPAVKDAKIRSGLEKLKKERPNEPVNIAERTK